MPVATPCPDPRHYQSLFAGQLAVADKEALLQHLEGCDSCVQTIQAMPGQDTLVDWIKQARTVAAPPVEQQLAALMQRMIQLVQPAAASSVSVAGSVVASKAAPPAGTLTFSCAGCRKPLRIKQEAAGKKVKCPHCKQVVLAHAATPASPPAAPPEAVETAVLPPRSTAETATVANLPAGSKEQALCAFLSPPQAPDEIGRLGPYRVLKVLGAGGMGVVFRAEDPQLQRLVALKAMLPALAANESARQRFLREARAAAKLKHDHIVTIHQVGEDRGAPFLAMEFLEGEALEDRLKREGKLPLTEVLRIGREIADGLEAAHEHGLIHRDIKPANVWLEKIPERGASAPRFRVKILDFGLARSSADEIHLTQSGAIVGTPAYMPQEQARGETVDARCDLYSLGCVLYRLCTGELPFKADNTMSLLLALATEQPKSPREINADVPPPLADLILRLLAKKPADRPATASEVADALQNIASAKAPEPEAVRVPAPPRRRRKLLAVAAAAAFLLAILATVIVVRLGGPDEGTVTIETVDPDVELVFRSGGRDVTVRDKKKGDEIKLPLGSYQVALKGGKDGLKLETDHFILKSGERVLVKVTRQSGEQPAAARADLPPPVQVPEPPPLAEWLKGRTILTVSQDGKGHFKTIQAALNALKPHHAIKVLDRGPYRERLELNSSPKDTGLISERGTVLELSHWKEFSGHEFAVTNGFRLNGFRMVAPAKKGFGAVSSWGTCGLVIENCLFEGPGGPVCSINLDPARAGLLQNANAVWIRNCTINTYILINERDDGRTTVVLQQNYFHGAPIECASELKRLLIRRNIIDARIEHSISLPRTPLTLEISNNTLLAPIHFVKSAPPQGVTICNNIIHRGVLLREGAEKVQEKATKNWTVEHNSYLQYRQSPDSIALAKAPTDCQAEPQFLSDDPAAPDYLHLPSDNPLAKAGAGGAWPSYIGALPPGPAPKDGDWFTRLRQRWDNVAPAAKPLSPPVQIPEPPPLAEWLKGRKVLTVSQDGKGQFKTIKEALDTLKPHQVVKVLDRGPYRESLRVGALPTDTGLISEQQTVLETPSETEELLTPGPLEGFRLSGFRILALPSFTNWNLTRWIEPSGLVIENCYFGRKKPEGSVIILDFGKLGDCKSAVVRDCIFDSGRVYLCSGDGRGYNVVLERNYFKKATLSLSDVRVQQLVVRHNIFDNSEEGRIWSQELKEVGGILEISNNTLGSKHHPHHAFSIIHTAPRGNIVFRNNCSSDPPIGFDGKAWADLGDSLKNWQLDHNCYIRRGALPKTSSDVLEEPPFLSIDPSHPDYLRIAADGPAAKGGAGGAWPSYIGALPPGPAPKEGDWFTRLREKWLKDKPAANTKP